MRIMCAKTKIIPHIRSVTDAINLMLIEFSTVLRLRVARHYLLEEHRYHKHYNLANIPFPYICAIDAGGSEGFFPLLKFFPKL